MKAKITIIVFVSVMLFFSCSRNDEAQKESLITNPDGISHLWIFSPQAGQTLKPGATAKIKWLFPKDISRVQITLYRKNEFKRWLCEQCENSGYYEWKIPTDIRNSVHYRINVASSDNPEINKFSEYFFIY